MFEGLFTYPNILARHQQGPESSKRARYLTHLANQGAARETLLRIARELLVIAERLDLSADRRISRIRLSDKTSRLCFRVQRLLQFLTIYRS